MKALQDDYLFIKVLTKDRTFRHLHEHWSPLNTNFRHGSADYPLEKPSWYLSCMKQASNSIVIQGAVSSFSSRPRSWNGTERERKEQTIYL